MGYALGSDVLNFFTRSFFGYLLFGGVKFSLQPLLFARALTGTRVVNPFARESFHLRKPSAPCRARRPPHISPRG